MDNNDIHVYALTICKRRVWERLCQYMFNKNNTRKWGQADWEIAFMRNRFRRSGVDNSVLFNVNQCGDVAVALHIINKALGDIPHRVTRGSMWSLKTDDKEYQQRIIWKMPQ